MSASPKKSEVLLTRNTSISAQRCDESFILEVNTCHDFSLHTFLTDWKAFTLGHENLSPLICFRNKMSSDCM